MLAAISLFTFRIHLQFLIQHFQASSSALGFRRNSTEWYIILISLRFLRKSACWVWSSLCPNTVSNMNLSQIFMHMTNKDGWTYVETPIFTFNSRHLTLDCKECVLFWHGLFGVCRDTFHIETWAVIITYQLPTHPNYQNCFWHSWIGEYDSWNCVLASPGLMPSNVWLLETGSISFSAFCFSFYTNLANNKLLTVLQSVTNRSLFLVQPSFSKNDHYFWVLLW